MTMKIFGAVLIVSGGFWAGKIYTLRLVRRMEILKDIAELFRCYDRELREKKRSIYEVFKNKGELALKILEHQPIRNLLKEERDFLEKHLSCLQTCSYQEALLQNERFLKQIDAAVETLEKTGSSEGKALPLVTATIGLFIAVLLF